jgi:hypothetical protein
VLKKGEKKVKILNQKIIAIAIVIGLIISIGASLILLPNVSAHDPAWNIPTYAYITAAPNPVGVGQQVNVFMFLTNYYYGAQSTNELRFHNFKLTITAPNGEISTQNFDTIVDTTSAQLATFTPTQTGTYNLTFTYPGETYTSKEKIKIALGGSAVDNPYTNDTFLASNATITLTVQSDPIPDPITSYPLPSEYWTRPIYGENTDWWSISSNWLGNGAPNYGGYTSYGEAMFPGDAIGSQTSHVMWTKALQSGGVVGGDNYDIQGQTYFDGSAYIIRYNNPIILNGKLYYKEPLSFGWNNNGGVGPLDCVDLRTGKVLWSNSSIPAPSFGLIMNVQTLNEHGVCPPLLIATSGTTWMGYDADTGTWLFNVTNVPTFGYGRVMGPDGEYLNYVMANAGNTTNPDWRLGEWNSTKIFMPGTTAAPALTGIKDGSISTGTNTLYDWNVSIGWRNTMSSAPTIIAAKYGDGILCYNGTLPSNGENMNFPTVSQTPYTYFFINLNSSKGEIGSVAWWKTLDPPANNYTVVQAGVDWENRVFLQSLKEGIMWVAYNLDSGEKLWQSEPQAAFDYYGSPGAGLLSGQIAYGKLYSMAMAGILYCYDIKTGNILWTYGNGGEGNSTNSGYTWPYGNIPTFVNAIGNDIVYLVTTEHTWTTPIYKDGLARAVNATDGKEIWTISSVTMEFSGTSYAMADGYNTWFNGYDNSVYVVGRGPSSTTVTASPKVQNLGNSIIVEGTVMDISSGTTQEEQAARFPSGVPVASDESMADWMGYVYQQKPMPSNASGVTVILSVVDANGNYRQIGETKTDLTGAYSYQWEPDISGKYTVYASFAGTNGYWPSSAETSFGIDEVATPQPTAAPQNGLATTSDLLTYIAASTVALIIAIAIAVIVLLKKKA